MISARAVALAIVAAAAAACANPYGICRPGTYRDPGPGCTAPSLAATIDGDASEWSRADLTPSPLCATCESGWAKSLQFAVDGDALVFHVGTEGAPVADADGEYHLTIYNYYDRARYDQIDVDMTSSSVDLVLNGHIVYGFTIDHAFGADGFEARVPFAAIPFVGAAATLAEVYRPDVGFQPQPSETIHVCWDPTKPENCATL